jgi:hypothetical protein
MVQNFKNKAKRSRYTGYVVNENINLISSIIGGRYVSMDVGMIVIVCPEGTAKKHPLGHYEGDEKVICGFSMGPGGRFEDVTVYCCSIRQYPNMVESILKNRVLIGEKHNLREIKYIKTLRKPNPFK